MIAFVVAATAVGCRDEEPKAWPGPRLGRQLDEYTFKRSCGGLLPLVEKIVGDTFAIAERKTEGGRIVITTEWGPESKGIRLRWSGVLTEVGEKSCKVKIDKNWRKSGSSEEGAAADLGRELRVVRMVDPTRAAEMERTGLRPQH